MPEYFLLKLRGMGWGWRWEGGSGWGTHVNTWLIHVNVWQKPLQYCKVISLQLIKINLKKEKKKILIKNLLYAYLCDRHSRENKKMHETESFPLGKLTWCIIIEEYIYIYSIFILWL